MIAFIYIIIDLTLALVVFNDNIENKGDISFEEL